MNTKQTHITEQLRELPTKPGIYIFRDERGSVLYVGKAKTLATRVRSYFQTSRILEPRKEPMVEKIANIEIIITPSERDALLVEANLIKEYQPPYNVILKDDKYFLYIRVTVSKNFPTVDLVRQITSKKNIYFGPFTSAFSARETLKVLKRVFKYRTCTPDQGKPCFDYTIGRCLGVCLNEISPTEYKKMIQHLLAFLRGNGDEVISKLQKEMETVSLQKKFERAALIRDRIFALEKIVSRQTVISHRREDVDIIGVATERRIAVVAILQIRAGKLMYKQTVSLTRGNNQVASEIMNAFIQQYYSGLPQKPSAIYTEVLPENPKLMTDALNIGIHRPQRGSKATLTRTAHENAQQALQIYLASFEKNDFALKKSLKKIQEIFSLSHLPVRIESFDVAHISGKHAVGAMIAFENGKPAKRLYKKFSIKTTHTPDDPRMMAEIVVRRIQRMKLKDSGWERPDLIILDGGKGQLSVVTRTLGTDKHLIPIVALAKGGHAQPTRQSERETFFLSDGHAIKLPATSRELFLLERIRDESHRFATSFYRKTHEKSQQKSMLDEIPGIGEKRKKVLLRHYGSVERVRRATSDELKQLVGKKMASQIKDFFT